MTEYIEREALEVALNHRLNFLMAENGEYDHYTSGFDEAVTIVENFPAADVPTVRHGRWIGCNGDIVDWDENNPGCPRHSCFCSICKSWLTASDEFPVIAYFCPNCGAKMDLEG